VIRYDVAIIPRETLSVVEAAIASLGTQRYEPQNIYVFDVGYTPAAKRTISNIVPSSQLHWISYDNFELANKCLSDLQARASSDWILVLENDCRLVAGDLAKAIGFAEEHRFNVIQPKILETDGRRHYDPVQSYIVEVDGKLVHSVIRTPREGYPEVRGPRRVFHIEKHAFVIRRSSLVALGPLEPFLVTRSHWDVSFRLHRSNDAILMYPDLAVEFMRAGGKMSDEAYYNWRWQRPKVVESNEYIKKKWNIHAYKSSVEWFDEEVKN
jgi:hypothetical protein